jgi:hypothetical protein
MFAAGARCLLCVHKNLWTGDMPFLEVLVGIAEPAALGVFYREHEQRSCFALVAVALNLQRARSGLRRPEGIIDDEALGVLGAAVMAYEQVILVYEAFCTALLIP